MSNKKLYNLFVVMFLTLIAFVCMAVASKNSFLYQFNESLDVNVFVVTVRGMMKGQILYKDIYDHKGPLLYFIYLLGMWIKSDSFVGIYIVESIFFSLYLYFAYKIAKLYTKNEYVALGITVVTAIVSSGNDAIHGGGQCEELALPFLAIIIYNVLLHFRNVYPKEIATKSVVVIGVCSSIVFWMKYSLLGIVAGLVLAIVILQIKNKQIRLIWKYIVEFVAGFVAGTIPVLIYFVATNSIGDLFEVYFYDNIFKYSGIDFSAKVTLRYLFFYERSLRLRLIPLLCVLGTVAFCFLLYDKLKKSEMFALMCMLIGMSLGVVSGQVWTYSTEIFCVFSSVAISLLVVFFYEYRKHFFAYINKIAGTICDWVEGKENNISLTLIISLIYAFIVRHDFAFNLIGAIIACYISRLLIKILARVKIGFVVRYLVLVGLYYWLGYDVPRTFCVLAFVIMLINDLGMIIRNHTIKFKTQKIGTVQRVLLNVVLIFAVVELLINSMQMLVRYSRDQEMAVENYPAYKMSEYIRTSGCENPVVVNYDTLDNGVYWFLDSYPPDRRFANNNASEEETKQFADKWIVSGQADFVVSSYFEPEFDNTLNDNGYQLVYSEVLDWMYLDYEYTYRLYEKVYDDVSQ